MVLTDVVDRPVVRPDQVTLGVLISQVSREEVDAAIAVCGVRERRSDGKLPAGSPRHSGIGLSVRARVIRGIVRHG